MSPTPNTTELTRTVDKYGNIRYLDARGNLHHPTRPAMLEADGRATWCRHGVVHNDDGPAIEAPGRDRHYYKDGVGHREDGPADEVLNRHTIWRLNRVRVDPVDVIDPWLERHHPGTSTATRAILLALADQWSFGDTLDDLHAAATAATT